MTLRHTPYLSLRRPARDLLVGLVIWSTMLAHPGSSAPTVASGQAAAQAAAADSALHLHARPGNGSVDVAWTAGKAACETFQVFRSSTEEKEWRPVGPETRRETESEGQVYRYRDGGLRPGGEYTYKLGCRSAGAWSYSSLVRATTLKAVLRFHGLYPNPTDAIARIDFEIAEPGPARLEIYDIRGNRLRTLLEGPASPGLASATWDGKDDAGRPQPPSVYIVRLCSAGQVLLRHIAIIREFGASNTH